MTIIYFKGHIACLQIVKKRYKELAMLHHPDRGGNTQTMQQINLEYEYIIKNQLFSFTSENEEKYYNEGNELRYPEIINQLLNLPGLIIELCGSWIWITGLTFPAKQQLKEIGCYFAPKKLAWYYRPPEYKSGKHKSLPMDKIRYKYGSTMIEGQRAEMQLS